MFAAKSGASHVYAVDNSSIIYKARENIKENGLESKITTFKGKIEEIQLPVEHVDIILSEWMGYFLLFEGMLDSVLYARDKWLNPLNGIMAPSHMTILVAGYSDSEYMNEHVHFWNDVYGFKMSAMKSMTRTDAHVDVMNPNGLLSEPIVLQEINTRLVTVSELDFSSDFILEIQRDGVLHGIVGWFDTYFLGPTCSTRSLSQSLNDSKIECTNESQDALKEKNEFKNDYKETVQPIIFSTGPQSTPTHWKQTLFLFNESINVIQGSKLKGKLNCRKSLENPRNLVIEIQVENLSCSFLLR